METLVHTVILTHKWKQSNKHTEALKKKKQIQDWKPNHKGSPRVHITEESQLPVQVTPALKDQVNANEAQPPVQVTFHNYGLLVKNK